MATSRRSAETLSLDEARTIVERIVDCLCLDYDERGEFYDPDKSLDGAEFIESVTTVLNEFDLVPSAIERLEEPAAQEFTVTYAVYSRAGQSIVGRGKRVVRAASRNDAVQQVAAWARENDIHFDERIDPQFKLIDVYEHEDDSAA